MTIELPNSSYKGRPIRILEEYRGMVRIAIFSREGKIREIKWVSRKLVTDLDIEESEGENG